MVCIDVPAPGVGTLIQINFQELQRAQTSGTRQPQPERVMPHYRPERYRVERAPLEAPFSPTIWLQQVRTRDGVPRAEYPPQ